MNFSKMLDPSIFWRIGNKYTGHTSSSTNIGRRRFKSMFGVTSNTCSQIWNLIEPTLPINCCPDHLLWALMFLRNYNIEEINCAICRVDEKTYRKYTWIIVGCISRMKVVSIIMIYLCMTKT